MTFLHPALLVFLALAGVPLLLHLVTLYRARTVELSTFRFLFDTFHRQQRRPRWQDLPLALLRVAAVLLMVLLVARPVVQNWGQLIPAGSGREVVLLVDGSASMNAQYAGVNTLQRAKAAARTVVGQLAADDRVTLVRLADRPEVVLSRLPPDAPEVRERLDGLTASADRANWLTAFRELFPSAGRAEPPLIYLFTDAQASGWRDGLDAAPRLPEGSRVIVVRVGAAEAPSNVGVIGRPPASSRAVVGLPTVLTPEVVNHSAAEVEVVLSAVIEEREAARESLTLKPGEKATRRMVYVPDTAGVKRGRFEVSLKGSDAFPDDDRFLFTIAVAPRARVLLVNGFAAPDPRDAESIYLRSALAAGALAVEEVLETDVAPNRLGSADVVVLANCGALTLAQGQALRDFVAGGGGLLIFPGDRVEPLTCSRDLLGGQGGRLIGADLTGADGSPDAPETFERLTDLNLDHPALSVLHDPDSRPLRTVRVFRRFTVKPAGAVHVLARFASGRPALVEGVYGQGRAVLAAFPAHVRWTNLPLKPEFVPLVLRLTEHVSRRPEVEGPSAVAAGALAEVTASPLLADAVVRVTDPRGQPLPSPDFQRIASRLVAGVRQTHERGYYTVDTRGRTVRGGTTDFAVNQDPAESDFAVVSEEALRAALPGAEVRVVDASAEAQQALGPLDGRTELWRWLLYGLFAFLSLELWLSTPRRAKQGSG